MGQDNTMKQQPVANTGSYSLSGRVFHKIREDILAGKYLQNDELREKAIADELGVSRTPVREALRQLELEGLVTIIPNKGASVVGISRKDIQDIYEIRSQLEGLCAKWATVNMTEELLNELEENIYLSEFHVQKQHFEQVLELDNKFHEVLYKTSNSKMLDHVLSDFHHYVERVRKITLSEAERAAKSIEEHKKIVEAMRNKDAVRAERLATEHIMNTISNMDSVGWENLV